MWEAPSRLRQSLVLLLVAAVVWACAGGVLWQAARIAHYHAVRWSLEKTSSTDTVRLTTASEVVWIEEDELQFEGCMFDVEERKRVGDEWLLIGHFDRADDEIFKLLDSLFGLESGHRGRTKRCAVFLPEAVVLDAVWGRPLRIIPLKPLHGRAPINKWHSVPRKALEHPPESYV